MSPTTVQPSIQKLVRLRAKTGQAPALRQALQTLEAATRQEAGCVEFTLLQSISDEATFVLLEHFTDKNAFDRHMQLPHTRTFFAAQLVEQADATDVASLGRHQ
jgi:quinol monooxygenase YgiN